MNPYIRSKKGGFQNSFFLAEYEFAGIKPRLSAFLNVLPIAHRIPHCYNVTIIDAAKIK
jgi:hypothetical protein